MRTATLPTRHWLHCTNAASLLDGSLAGRLEREERARQREEDLRLASHRQTRMNNTMAVLSELRTVLNRGPDATP